MTISQNEFLSWLWQNKRARMISVVYCAAVAFVTFSVNFGHNGWIGTELMELFLILGYSAFFCHLIVDTFIQNWPTHNVATKERAPPAPSGPQALGTKGMSPYDAVILIATVASAVIALLQFIYKT